MIREFKVTGVISGRYDGNTAALVREALKGAEEEGAVVKEIFLPEYNLKFCTGCLKCMSAGKCPLADGFSEIRDILCESDGIIWGSPTYCGAPNAMMKNLFDRLGMYCMLTSLLGGKYMAGISTAGSAATARKVAGDLVKLTSNGVFQRGFVSGILGEGYKNNSHAKEDEKALSRARSLGNRISNDIKTVNHYPMQNLFSRILNNFILKSVFTKYIIAEKDSSTKAVFSYLDQRGYI